MPTKLEKANQALHAGWSRAARDRTVLQINKAADLTQDFIAYQEGGGSPICATSLALIIDEILSKLENIEYDLARLERRLDGLTWPGSVV